MKTALLTMFLAIAGSSLVKMPPAFAQRVPWTTSKIVGSPDPPKEHRLQRVYPHMEFNQPVELMPLGNTGKMAVLEVGGKLFTFDDEQDCREKDLVIDLKHSNEELLRAYGFGLHPNFDQNRQVFVVYSCKPVARPDGTRLSRFTMSKTAPLTINANSEEILLTWASGGHNGSTIRFDSKGLLYFSAGDGAKPYPPDEYNVGQDLSDLRSTICRIDVDSPDGDKLYSIPPDNPFIETEGARPEVYAFGFRNPWRFTIVPGTDQLLCGDVGWELWEMIFDVKRGGNYGWSLFEGPQPIRGDVTLGPAKISAPLVAYPHHEGQSVTGGNVYRGDDLPELRGAYLYGDYVSGLLWGLRHDGEQVTWNPVVTETGIPIITFAETRDHETLVVGYDGHIYQLVRNEAVEEASEFPRLLSQTGLFASTKRLKPAAGVLPYSIAAQSWEGETSSEYLAAIPGKKPIVTQLERRGWVYPTGTVFAKTISQPAPDGQQARVETQVIHFNGITWQPYSYLWNANQTDASLVGFGALSDPELQNPHWPVQNRSQCASCHLRQNGGAIGFSLENLGEKQVQAFVRAGVLDRVPPAKWKMKSMVDPTDDSAALEDRARSYLAANCAHCHRRGGGGTVPLDLVYRNSNAKLNAIDMAPMQGAFEIKDAKVIGPGDPYRSVLYYRMATSGVGHMPKLRAYEIDTRGLKLIHDWIGSLSETPASQFGDRQFHDQALEKVLVDTSASLAHFSRLAFDVSDSAKQQEIASQAVNHENLLTAALYERFLPIHLRRKQLGTNIDRAAVLAMAGNADRGRMRFFSGAMQCISCHRVQGTGITIGADLDGVGKKRSREQLLDSILEPSKEIDKAFQAVIVLTAAGVVHTGIPSTEDNTVMRLRIAGGKEIAIPKAQIEEIIPAKLSMMPSGIAETMTAQELADLLEFLVNLK